MQTHLWILLFDINPKQMYGLSHARIVIQNRFHPGLRSSGNTSVFFWSDGWGQKWEWFYSMLRLWHQGKDNTVLTISCTFPEKRLVIYRSSDARGACILFLYKKIIKDLQAIIWQHVFEVAVKSCIHVDCSHLPFIYSLPSITSE